MLFGSALLAAMLLAAPVRAADQDKGSGSSANDPDKTFIEAASVHGMFEQKLSEVAAQQASDSRVKQFAQKMVDDHKNANEQLKQVAQKIGVSVPGDLPEMKQRELDAIKSQQGKDFDQAYLSCMKALHLHDVSVFADKAQIAKNQDVKQFAQQTLPTLQQHQQHVISLASAQGLPSTITGDAQSAGARIGASGSSGSNGTSGGSSGSSSGGAGSSGSSSGGSSGTSGDTNSR
jgi:putative membrane protein